MSTAWGPPLALLALGLVARALERRGRPGPGLGLCALGLVGWLAPQAALPRVLLPDGPQVLALLVLLAGLRGLGRAAPAAPAAAEGLWLCASAAACLNAPHPAVWWLGWELGAGVLTGRTARGQTMQCLVKHYISSILILTVIVHIDVSIFPIWVPPLLLGAGLALRLSGVGSDPLRLPASLVWGLLVVGAFPGLESLSAPRALLVGAGLSAVAAHRARGAEGSLLGWSVAALLAATAGGARAEDAQRWMSAWAPAALGLAALTAPPPGDPPQGSAVTLPWRDAAGVLLLLAALALLPGVPLSWMSALPGWAAALQGEALVSPAAPLAALLAATLPGVAWRWLVRLRAAPAPGGWERVLVGAALGWLLLGWVEVGG